MSKIKFRAPKKDPIFRKHWNQLLPKIVERDNFHEGYLKQLEILCQLYVDYSNLTKFVEENGYSFKTDGRYGETSRPHVETQLMTKVLAEIRAYSKLLGLIFGLGALFLCIKKNLRR